jgi:hypothetical protein
MMPSSLLQVMAPPAALRGQDVSENIDIEL